MELPNLSGSSWCYFDTVAKFQLQATWKWTFRAITASVTCTHDIKFSSVRYKNCCWMNEECRTFSSVK